ncbi:hypothetical protein V6N13_078345 [Hibiscus sabdariffa]
MISGRRGFTPLHSQELGTEAYVGILKEPRDFKSTDPGNSDMKSLLKSPSMGLRRSVSGRVSFSENEFANRLKGRKSTTVQVVPYSLADLQKSTDNFAPNRLLGKGTIGCVYRAKYPDGKLLYLYLGIDSSLFQDQKPDDFSKLFTNISKLHHPNIAELVGYCSEQGHTMLIYDYFRNGSLHAFLHVADDFSKPLTWNTRVRIALGVARAVEYLHDICSPSIVHKNIKSSNIFLDLELNPHLSDSDYGIACFHQHTSQNLGMGYNAPECTKPSAYTSKSDVYSFGVVMLELLTVRMPVDKPRSEQCSVKWARPRLHDHDALIGMVDPALRGLCPPKSLPPFADIVSLCVQADPAHRAPISEVVHALVRCVICGGVGISDAYYCKECTQQEKDRDGCPKIVNLGSAKTDLFYERKNFQPTSGKLQGRRWRGRNEPYSRLAAYDLGEGNADPVEAYTGRSSSGLMHTPWVNKWALGPVMRVSPWARLDLESVRPIPYIPFLMSGRKERVIQQPSSFIKSALTMAGKGNNAVFRQIVKKCNKIENESLSTGLHLMLLNKELCNMHKMLGEQQAVLNEDLKHLKKFLSEIEIKIDEQSAPKIAKDYAENHYKEFDENPSIQPDLKGVSRYLTYEIGGECPVDDVFAQKLIHKGCEPLPRRRCHSKSPVGYVEPTPFPDSLWSIPSDSSIIWEPYTCKSYNCLINRDKLPAIYDCKDCFNLQGREKARWLFDRGLDYGIEQVLEMKPAGSIRMGLDIGGGSGTFAARMRERNITIITTSMNLDGPFNSFIESRGLIPMHVSISQRLPFFENTLDIVHSMHVLSNWIPDGMLELTLYDIYRVLRLGGLFWLDHFFCQGLQLNQTYAPM